MNYAGFLPAGVMILVFGISTGVLLPRSRLILLGSALLTLFGAGTITAGLVSCDVGCPQGTGSLANRIHDSISPVSFLSAIAGIATVGLSLRRINVWRSMGNYSLVTSAVSFGLILGLIQSLDGRALTGLWQRLFVATVFAWCAVLGLLLFLGRDRVRQRAPL
jgi:hypothetical protein